MPTEGRFTGEYEITPPTKTTQKAGGASGALTFRLPDLRPDNAYDSEQLRSGIIVEMEHTDDRDVAKKIAKDHLDEDARYYINLIEMEQQHKNNEIKGRLH